MEVVTDNYKLTDVGVIPEDWEVKSLSDLSLKIGSGITPRGGESVYKEQGRPLVRSQNIGWGKLLLENIAYIDDEIHSTFLNTEIKFQDVLLNISGASIGRSSYSNECLVGGNVNQHVCIIRTDKNLLNPIFLNLFLLSKNGQQQIDSFQSGGNRQGLNIGQIRIFQIPLPPTLHEQTAIATALSDTDAFISSLEKLIAKKRDIKQGAMQELLRPKDGWEVKELEHNIDLLTGFPFPSNKYSSKGIKLLRGSNIKRGVTDWSEDITQYWEKITPELKQYLLSEGDIVIAMDGSLVGKSFAKLSKKDLPSVLLQRVARVRSTKIDMGYLKEFICSDYFTRYCDTVKTSSAIPHISPTDIKKFRIPVPNSIEEQKDIAETLSDMDSEITALEAKLSKYKDLKQGMMQNLLTGKIRLV